MTIATIASPLDPVGSRQRARRSAAGALRRRLRLPPRITLSEWSDRHRVLSPESSAEAGQWRTERVPYLREIMDTISGREYRDITIVKSSQTAGTEALNNAVGYYIDQEPSPILMIQPNVKPMAEAWSKDRLAPMLRDCPRLRGKVKDPRARDSGNTVLHKVFPGGYITVVGANSPAGLASRPIRIILADELDRWTASAGTEGDPLSLAEARTITFRHRKKIVKVSTPGNEGESRIEKEWAASDQRHYYVACPHCSHEQPLEWRDSQGKPGITNARGKYRLVWEKEGDGEGAKHKPETARYQCRSCEGLIEESHKAEMLACGRWVKHNPSSSRAGFHISGLLSPWVRWSEIADEWLKKKDDHEQRKGFFNTMLGLLYSSEGEVPDASRLEDRREQYAAEVPMGVGVLSAFIDVHLDRLEMDVRGWGHDEESWHIRLERIYGDPEGDEVWQRAEELLVRPWQHESGATMRIAVCMVDSGYNADAVYRFVRPRQTRGVYASKGNDNAKEPLSRASRANRDGVKVFTFKPAIFKDVLFARLKRPVPGRGYLHFGTLAQTGADEAYFQQFGAEKRHVEYEGGKLVVRYTNPGKKRNESIDHYVGNLVGLRSMGMGVSRTLGERAKRVQQQGEALKQQPAAPERTEQHPMQRPAPPRRGGFVNEWKRWRR